MGGAHAPSRAVAGAPADHIRTPDVSTLKRQLNRDFKWNPFIIREFQLLLSSSFG
jgi:hypothetical protein